MNLLAIVLIIIVAGFLLWLAETYIPMDPGIKKIMRFLVIGVIILWLLQIFGVFEYVGAINVHGVGGAHGTY
jgi:1-acyl-sn-glycerol-3-phosphate acyltransferase